MPITTLQRLEKDRADALAKAARLDTQIAEQKRRMSNEQAATIDALPKRLGVANLEAVLALVRARMKGEFGSLAPGAAPASNGPRKPPTRLNDEQRAKLDEMIKANATGAAICAAIPCSIGTVATRKRFLRDEEEKQKLTTPPAPAAVVA